MNPPPKSTSLGTIAGTTGVSHRRSRKKYSGPFSVLRLNCFFPCRRIIFAEKFETDPESVVLFFDNLFFRRPRTRPKQKRWEKSGSLCRACSSVVLVSGGYPSLNSPGMNTYEKQGEGGTPQHPDQVSRTEALQSPCPHLSFSLPRLYSLPEFPCLK